MIELYVYAAVVTVSLLLCANAWAKSHKSFLQAELATRAVYTKYYMLQLEYMTYKKLKVNKHDQQFTQDEIKTLISLCHPDKHGNKPSATTISKKLLSMRDK